MDGTSVAKTISKKQNKMKTFILTKGSPEWGFSKVMALFCRVKTLFQTHA